MYTWCKIKNIMVSSQWTLHRNHLHMCSIKQTVTYEIFAAFFRGSSLYWTNFEAITIFENFLFSRKDI
jgi:hypothetical protein